MSSQPDCVLRHLLHFKRYEFSQIKLVTKRLFSENPYVARQLLEALQQTEQENRQAINRKVDPFDRVGD